MIVPVVITARVAERMFRRDVSRGAMMVVAGGLLESPQDIDCLALFVIVNKLTEAKGVHPWPLVPRRSKTSEFHLGWKRITSVLHPGRYRPGLIEAQGMILGDLGGMFASGAISPRPH